MKAPVENYKGIEFIRISSLPDDQQQKIEITLNKQKVIRILTDAGLFRDCVQYSDYSDWYSKNHKVEKPAHRAKQRRSLFIPSLSQKKVVG